MQHSQEDVDQLAADMSEAVRAAAVYWDGLLFIASFQGRYWVCSNADRDNVRCLGAYFTLVAASSKLRRAKRQEMLPDKG